jgi:hypothetical protein
MTISTLSKRLESLEQAGSQENKIFQFPELRELMRIADSGLESMYDYFDTHARQDIYPDIETRRGYIQEIYDTRNTM